MVGVETSTFSIMSVKISVIESTIIHREGAPYPGCGGRLWRSGKDFFYVYS